MYPNYGTFPFTAAAILAARENLSRFVVERAERCATIRGFRWVAQQDAPNDYPALLKAHSESMQTLAPLPVYDGGCDNTIYTSPEANHAFRFWHDIGHVGLDADFTPAGESRVVDCQAAMVADRFGKESTEHRMFLADTLGQVAYFAIHGDFPENQLAFVMSALHKF